MAQIVYSPTPKMNDLHFKTANYSLNQSETRYDLQETISIIYNQNEPSFLLYWIQNINLNHKFPGFAL